MTSEDTTTQDTETAAPVEVSPENPSQDYGITNVEELKAGEQNQKNPDDQSSEVDEQDEIDAVLARTTHDGKGEDPVPPADFASFATKGVENVSDEELNEIATRILAGRLGSDEQTVRQELSNGDYNPSTIFAEVNRRISEGAPSALPKPSTRDVARQVILGEWGGEDREIKRRLEGAGHVVKNVYDEVKKQLGR